MVLNAEEEQLVRVIRGLPPGEARKVLTWATQLADVSGGRGVEWSDAWTDADVSDAAAASLRRFEEQENIDA